ncbi:MAG: type IV pilin [Candidatus Aenigmatarchaeota archaeon]
MKGITPVIAIILLLLITISMVGFAFVWFQRVAATATSATDTQLQSQLNQQGQQIKIEGASGTTVSFRSNGNAALPAGSVLLFVNGSSSTSGSCPAASAAAGSVFTCTTTVGACSGTSTLRASAPGNSDQMTC